MSSAHARTLSVDTTLDDRSLTACDDATPDDCSLRGAISAAGAAAEHSDILLPAGTYAMTAEATHCPFVSGYGGVYNELVQSFCLYGDVSIIGAGAATTTVDGVNANRVFTADATTTTTISGVTITRGNFDFSSLLGAGGGILNHGAMTLTDVAVVANFGNGIYNAGDLTLERCVVTDNVGPGAGGGSGGGIWNLAPYDLVPRKQMRIADSTIARNVADRGAGMDSWNSVVTILGSTVSDNVATGQGGGIVASSNTDMEIVNTTVTGNSAFNGGGINVAVGNCTTCVTALENVTVTGNEASHGGGMSIAGTVKIRNTIVAGNGSPGDVGPECLGDGYVSEGYNLIGSDPDEYCGPTTGDLTGNQTTSEPMLGALALNGGLTATRVPLPTSPAIDHGSPAAPGEGGGSACAAVDQRHVLRPIGDRCDIGAVERSSALAVTAVTPAHAGNRSAAILAVGGGGFAPGATVVLRRAGHADIAADPPTIDPAGAALTASFALTGAELGAWDLVVTNTDAATAVLAGAFTVEAAREADVYAAVVGRSGARAGVPGRYTIWYGNRGNTEALAVPLTLILPATFAHTLRFEIAPPPEQPGRPYDDYSHVPLAVTTDVVADQVSLPLLIPIIPPGFTGILEFTLTPPAGIGHGTAFRIEAAFGRPWIDDGVVRPEVVAEAAVRARTFANARLGTTATSALDPALIAYETNALTLAVASSRAVLLNGFGQTGRAYSAAFLAIDLAGYATDLAAASETSVDAVWRRLGGGLGLLTAPVYAGGVCPPCSCPASTTGLTPGCSECPACKPAVDPDHPPKEPPSPLTPAGCAAIPNHEPSADGRLCKPKNPRGCPLIPNPFLAETNCLTFPLLASIDPNDKTGSGGSGPERYVPADTPMPYSIAFENLPAATAPAQTVVITDQLDTATLDLATFTLGPIMVGANVTITPPAGVTTFTGGADMRPARDVLLKVDAGLDQVTGLVTWTFTSLDPATLQPLDDPLGGFLPPNTDPPAGDGQVNFTIQPKAGLPSGTAIKNRAQVIFDFNAPIDTPEWLNTVDAVGPSSHVDSVDPLCGATDVTVHWSGSDADSGVSTYSVFVSTDGGPYVPLVTDTADTSAPFSGELGKSYRFYTTARDHAGNVEAAPAAADVTHALAACGTHDLAITAITAPKKVALTAKKPTRLVKLAVQIENRSPHPETILDAATLASLVELDVASLAVTCVAPTVTLHAGKPKLPVTIKPKKKLKVLFDVTIACANDPAKGGGHEDYRVSAQVHRAALGEPDVHPVDDVCPRSVTPPSVVDPYPDGKIHDKGCGAKKPDKTRGGEILIDVTVK